MPSPGHPNLIRQLYRLNRRRGVREARYVAGAALGVAAREVHGIRGDRLSAP